MPAMSRLFVGLSLFAWLGICISGCSANGTPILGSGGGEASAAPEGVSSRAGLTIAIDQGSLRGSLKTAEVRGATLPSVTCTLTLFRPGTTGETPQTFTQTVEARDGKATIEFFNLPVLPVIAEVRISGGKIGSDSQFHGGGDLVAGPTNTITVGAVDSRTKADLLATLGKRIIASSTLLAQSPAGFFATVEQAIAGLATNATSVYDTALTRFAAIIPPDPTVVWSGFFPDGLIDANKTAVGFPVLKNKIVGLYFSASWCTYCAQFTPSLLSFRNANTAEFEIVLIPSDTSEAAQLAYMKDAGIPGPTVPFTSSAVNALKQQFSVTGIPKLIILSARGTLLTSNGRSDVTNAPTTCLQSWKNMAAAQ